MAPVMMTMKPLQRQDDKNIINRYKGLVINLPIIVGITVLFCIDITSWVLLWISQHKMPKGGISGFLMGFFIETFFGQIIPFLIIALIVRGLIRKGAGKTEIFIKLAFMLIPVSIVTSYWLFKYIDPFARGLLLFINGFLLFIGLLLGIVVCKIIKNTVP
ncbi:MAG: hypothetical protein WA126_12250 [Thermodesulfovibrionales bacterium]